MRSNERLAMLVPGRKSVDELNQAVELMMEEINRLQNENDVREWEYAADRRLLCVALFLITASELAICFFK